MMDGSTDMQGRDVELDDGSERTQQVRLFAATRGGRDVALIDEGDGRALRLVPRADLTELEPHRVRLARPLADYDRVDRAMGPSEDETTTTNAQPDDDAAVVPILEESLEVGRRQRTTARVHVRKWTEREPVQLDEILSREEVEVERVLLDRPLNGGEEARVRLDGETLIIPVVEERLVVTKELVLREEVHVTRRRHQRRESGQVELRRVRVDVDRRAVDDDAHAAGE